MELLNKIYWVSSRQQKFIFIFWRLRRAKIRTPANFLSGEGLLPDS
jgi:hypothetical protein